VVRQRDRVTTLGDRARRAVGNLLAARASRAERAGQLLAAFSYRGVLSRGFALVRDEAGHPLRAAAAVQPGMALDIEFADGRVGATAGTSHTPTREPAPATAPPQTPRRKGGGSGGSGQGSLFG